MRDWGIDLIKPAQRKKIRAPHGKARRGQRRNRAHRLRKIGVIHRIALPLMHGCAHKSAHTSDQAGVLNARCRVKQFRRDRANVLILQGFDDILNPIALPRFNVVVKKNYALATCHLSACVAFSGKVERCVEGDEPNLTADRFG